MKIEHIEVIVEEPSMEALLQRILLKILRPDVTFAIYTHSGKDDLLAAYRQD